MSINVTGELILDTVLDQLASYIDRDIEARQKIMGALIYPLVVVALSLASMAVLVIYVLPKFKSFFDSLHANLPLPTRIMIAGGDFFGNWWWLLALGLVTLAVAAAVTMRTERGKSWRDTIILHLPLV